MSTDPGGLDLPETLDGAEVAGSGRDWLARAWDRGEVRAALRVASPVLSRRIDAVLDGETVEDRDLRRLLVSVSSYLRRWQRRATPFGLFAGVAAVSAGTGPAPLRSDYRVAARADARWLGRVIDDLERHPRLFTRLAVVVNDAGFLRGDRFVVSTRLDGSQAGQSSALDIAVRLTRPVRAVLAAAQAPVPVARLVERLGEQFPAVSADHISSLLRELVSSGALLTSLRAPMTTVDALGDLITQLQAVGADELGDLTERIARLTEIREQLTCSGRGRPQDMGPLLESVAERMRAVHKGTEKVLAVDVALADRCGVPAEVLGEAEAAATAMLRLTPYPFGSPSWRDFHSRFLARYGPGARVPVGDVVADSGLGYPAGFLGAARPHGPHALSERDARLLTLIQQATVDGTREIVLTEDVIDQLRVGDHDRMIAPERVELAFQLHARSIEALARGRFRLWVTGALHTGSMAGRFAHLLPEPDRHLLAQSYTPAREHTVAAQLSFLPRREHNENITRVPRLLPQVISLGEYHDEHEPLLRLDDIAVTADHTRLSLVRITTGEAVLPRVLHALESSVQTPPLARFLAEVSAACCGFYGLLDFGAAREMPFLPRVRHGRAVLSPAQWRLSHADLALPDIEVSTWERALHAWRDRWHVPAAVLLVEGELRLPLDLDDHRDRTLLRHRLQRISTGHLVLRERGDHQGHAWSGRVCELLVPLKTIRKAPTAGGDPPPRTVRPVVPRSDVLLPGNTTVLRADLCAHAWRFDDLLTGHLPGLVKALDDLLLRWWFTRWHDPTRPDSDQSLRLFLRLRAPGDYGAGAARVADWATGLRDAGLLADLTFGSYQPPRGVYGHGPALEAAVEAVFAADSAAALAQLSWTARTGTARQAIAAASLVDIATGLAETLAAGYRCLCDLLPQERGKLDGSLRAAALQLAGSAAEPPCLPADPAVVTAWDQRRDALAIYRDHLGGDGSSAILRALFHAHHLRAVGVDPGTERVTHRLARAIAQRQMAQPPARQT